MKQKRPKLSLAAARNTSSPKSVRKGQQGLRDALSAPKVTLPPAPWEKDDKSLDKKDKL